MTRSYRLGIQIVLGAILLAAGGTLAWAARRAPVPARTAEQLTPGSFPLGDFRLIERSGRDVTQADFRGRVWVAAFIFTRCPLSCPRISSVMKDLQQRFAGTSVLLASISVDPDYDTPAVLNQYAQKFEARPDRWWFLTGDKAEIHALVQGRFKLGDARGFARREGRGFGGDHAQRSAGVGGRWPGDRIFRVKQTRLRSTPWSPQASRRALPGWVQVFADPERELERSVRGLAHRRLDR